MAISSALRKPGDVVLGRFEVESLAGTGGMGIVWRARDRRDGAAVALKELQRGGVGASRFEREARVLASLSHPGIVRYVAHGLDDDGHPFLVMEWLDGEDLARRISTQPLTIAESLRVVAQIADAVGHAHDRRALHRDLKPENVFLQDRDLARVKLVDFGVARAPWTTLSRTQTGAFVGTPMYAAPEQARGDRTVGPASDVFALGCVLYECVTGKPAFAAQNMIAALAKVVVEDAPRLLDVRADVPPDLDALVARMLAKKPAERPADGTEAAREIRAVLASLASSGSPAARAAPRPALTAAELRVVSVLLVRAPRAVSPSLDPEGDATLDLEADASFVRELVALVGSHGATATRLADGAVLVSVTGGGVASDDAVRAARLALAVVALRPGLDVAVATGRGDAGTTGETSAVRPVGDAIERAAALLRANVGAGVVVDSVTAGLLDARFRLEGNDTTGLVLREEREGDHASRTLLGRPVPCVGRDREIADLVALFDECIDESRSRAVLVTAPPGVGKSRLARELVRTLRADRPVLRVLSARADPIGAGAPFAMAADLIRRAAGLVAGESLDATLGRIRSLVAHVVTDAADEARIVAFLAELAGAPPTPDVSVQLVAARADPMLMGDQMRRALEDWLFAEASRAPFLLVMEDLHWGDVPSVRAIEGALRHLAELPFVVLGLARPDVRAAFPDLWSGRGLVHVELPELSKKAAEKLVRAVLGDRADRDPELVARLVARGAGNAFFLEELVRAVAEGAGADAMPDTVMAMVQSRLEALDPESRRVLRAASVFGRASWPGAIRVLLGGAERSARLPIVLDRLVELDWLVRRDRSRFADEREHAFRHALVQEGAYAMLTAEDRALGHRLAAGWLEVAGETDAAVIAEHHERGGEPANALACYRRAVAQALEGNDFDSVRARVGRARALGAKGEMRGELALRLAEAHKWRGDNEAMAQEAAAAAHDLAPGSDLWCNAIADACSANARLGRHAAVAPLTVVLATRMREDGPSRALLVAALRVAETLYVAGQATLATMLLSSAEEVVSSFEHDPTVRARLLTARARAQIANGHVADVELYEAAAREHERAGDVRNAQLLTVSAAWARRELGMYAEAERGYRAALAASMRMGTAAVAAAARGSLGTVLVRLGGMDEGLSLLREAVAEHAAHSNRRLEGSARVSLALALVDVGDLESAEKEGREATRLLSGLPAESFARAALATVLRVRGRIDDACSEAKAASAHLAKVGFVAQGESLVRLALPECLAAAGDDAGARAALADARTRLLARAEAIRDPAQRASFLERVPESARTLALSVEWGIAPAQ